MSQQYKSMMETARFPDWNIVDFRNFYKSFLQNDDLDDIASKMTTKTPEQTEIYYHVFVQRSKGLRMCHEDLTRKAKEQKFRELNQQTILDFNQEKMNKGK